jgi:CBS domain-containing protein
MNTQTQRYNSAFRRIEHRLKVVCGAGEYLPFYKLIENAARKNSVVGQYERILRHFGSLRNVLVHERQEYAVPNERAVLQIEAIATTLESPPKLIPMFSMNVATCTLTDSIGSASRTMYDRRFSQLPVVDGTGVVGLLTAETIARWLATRLQSDGILESEPVEAVLKHREKDSTYILLGPDASIFDALASFDDALHAGSDLDAIFVTNNGSKSEGLMGILTPFDIPRLIREAQLNTD